MPPDGPRTKDVIPGVFSRHAAAYRDRVMGAVGRGEARGRTRVVELLRPGPGDRVLDVGCGPGVLTLPLAEAVGPSGLVLAVDLAEGMLALTRAAAPVWTGVARMDMEALGVAAGAFDAVASGHSLQFMPDLALALAEIRRALRPGGRFAASVPANDGPNPARAVLDEVFASRLPAPPQPADSHATRAIVHDVGRLATALAAAGFRDVSAETVEEASTFDSPSDLVARSMGWWVCAWQLEAVPDDVRDAVRAEAVEVLTARFGEGPVSVPGGSLVVAGVR